MSDTIFKSSIWLKSLDESSNYSQQFKDEVELLRVSFKDVRKKAHQIAEYIHESQPDLTLHDTSHLDSLWETANTIAGEELILNPIEAYVFGCSVLCHDLGMALALWENDIDVIKESNEYQDIVFSLYTKELKRNPTQEELSNIPKSIESFAISARLRDLHAFKAKDLPMQSWDFNGERISMIESSDLKQKLGPKIGLIAESHWWYIDEIRAYFNNMVISPAPTNFPNNWNINNVKLACLLRLADFIHIDDRRAPTLQYSLLKPKGISDDHWNFQNKLNRALYEDGRICFVSHTKFKYTESEAWWLAYNTLKEIDKEIRSVDNLLNDLKLTRFQTKGVKGIETPALCANYLQTDSWEPADTQFKISDFQNLIEKLGGRQLYGDHPNVPLREIIQNSCDALQAKQFYSPHFKGTIRVDYYTDDAGKEWLEIEDNGIGMSKSALLYGLLDFGNSYWKSNLSRKEHPGLLSSGFSPIGNYGIGFFSVFMISDFIQVITKSITEGAQTVILEFNNGLTFNPILRKARTKEQLFESGTTIKIAVNEHNLINKIYKSVAELSDVTSEDPLSYSCRRIAPALSQKLVTCFNKGPIIEINAGNDWQHIDSNILLKRISGFGPDETEGWNLERLNYISEFVKPIFNKEGNMVARATIVKQLPSNNAYSGYGVVTVGGLNQIKVYRFPGIWVGKNEVVARNSAKPICTYSDLRPWLEEQYNLVVNSVKLSENEKIDIAKSLYALGFPCKKLPIANTSEGWKTYDDLVKMEFGDHVLLRFVVKENESSLNLFPNILYAQMGTPIIDIDRDQIFFHEGLWHKELIELDKANDTGYDNESNHRSMLGFTIKAICESWGIDEKEVVQESMIDLAKWKPIVDTYTNNYGETVKEPVCVIVNPKLSSKKEMYKKYEMGIKRWIGISSNEDFDVDDLI